MTFPEASNSLDGLRDFGLSSFLGHAAGAIRLNCDEQDQEKKTLCRRLRSDMDSAEIDAAEVLRIEE